jgi:hypothetical protein
VRAVGASSLGMTILSKTYVNIGEACGDFAALKEGGGLD